MKSFSIRTKLAGITSVVVALVVSFMAVAGFHYFASEFKNEVAKHHFAMLTMAANNLDNQVRRSQAVLNGVMQSFPPESIHDHAAMQRFLDTKQDARSFFDGGFLLIDAVGKILCESPSYPGRLGKDHRHRDYVRKTLETGNPVISAPYIAGVPPYEPTITFTTPIKDKNGKVTGMLAGRHLLLRDNFLSDLGKMSIGKTGYLYLIDRERTFIMHHNKSRVMEKLPPGRNIGMDKALDGFEGTIENINSLGVSGLTSFKRLNSVPWIIASHYPLTEAYAPLYKGKGFLFAAVLLVLAVSLGAVLVISRRITSPLLKLSKHVRALPGLAGEERKIVDVPGDEIGGLASAFNDMLDQLDARQLDIQKGQEVYEIMAKFTSELVILRNLDGSLRYISPNCETMTGYTTAEFLESDGLLEQIIHPDDLERWRNHLDLSCNDRVCRPFDMRIVKKGGKVLWLSHACHGVTDDQGEIVGNRGSFRDISGRKDIEQKLLKQQAEQVMQHEQLKALFQQVESAKKDWEQTMDCIGAMVIMTDGDGLIRRCNREASNFIAKDSKKILGRSWDDLFSDLGMELGKKFLEGHEVYHTESNRWFLLNNYPLGMSAAGRQLGSVITIHDITEQKGTHAELESAYSELHESSKCLEKAFAELKTTHMQLLQQEKMASIGQLAAGVAHEINNPMGFISSNLQTLGKYTERLKEFMAVQNTAVQNSETNVAAIAEARKKYKVDYVLEDIPNLIAESSEGAERVRVIVQNLKSFSRVDENEATPVDLNKCLESTISIAWNELKYKATLKKDFGDLPLVNCHPQQINQVFLNLLVNAAHAIEKQGEIIVKSWQEGKNVYISIGDSGSGIPEEIRTRIFEPFFTTKEVGKGTGLGLSISYEIVKQHNGTITVTSEVGIGTTFTIHLPIDGK